MNHRESINKVILEFKEEYMKDSCEFMNKWSDIDEKALIISLDLLITSLNIIFESQEELRFPLGSLMNEANGVLPRLIKGGLLSNEDEIRNNFIFKSIEVRSEK